MNISLKKRTFLILLAGLTATFASAQEQPLPEWQSQYAVGLNKLAPHTYVWPYANASDIVMKDGVCWVMDIALMNETVVFQKCSVVKDGIGNHRNEWTEDYCCFATIGGEGLASSREAETAGTVVEDVGMTVTVRYCKKTAGIRSVTHRILFRDQVYDIVSVDHLNYKKKCLKFTCRKVRR